MTYPLAGNEDRAGEHFKARLWYPCPPAQVGYQDSIRVEVIPRGEPDAPGVSPTLPPAILDSIGGVGEMVVHGHGDVPDPGVRSHITPAVLEDERVQHRLAVWRRFK